MCNASASAFRAMFDTKTSELLFVARNLVLSTRSDTVGERNATLDANNNTKQDKTERATMNCIVSGIVCPGEMDAKFDQASESLRVQDPAGAGGFRWGVGSVT